MSLNAKRFDKGMHSPRVNPTRQVNFGTSLKKYPDTVSVVMSLHIRCDYCGVFLKSDQVGSNINYGSIKKKRYGTPKLHNYCYGVQDFTIRFHCKNKTQCRRNKRKNKNK